MYTSCIIISVSQRYIHTLACYSILSSTNEETKDKTCTVGEQ